MVDDAVARARVGSVLNDKWMLEELLGVGGMGAVYAARHTRNGARAAVKVLHPDLAREKDIRERFLREGRAANAVQHPGVVKVIDDDPITTGPDAGSAYLVMELLKGESLEDRLERAPSPTEREVLEVADAVLDVLAAAHARGVVHRDLKPENIFLASDPATGRARWMVLDFGLARLLDAEMITRHGMAIGTPAYMSPEQATGRRDEIDGRADLFSLAATCFRVLAGRRVHEGSSPVEVVLKMGSVPAPHLRDVAPSVSEGVARVIDRALAFRREDRYPDAAAMRDDVRRAIAALDPSAAPTLIADAEPVTIADKPASLPEPAPRTEKTLELSAGDLEPVSQAERPPTAPAIAPAEPPEASVPAPHPPRPSFIPALTALFLGALVVKLALDAERSKHAADTTVAAQTAAAPDLAFDGATTALLGLADAGSEYVPASASVIDGGDDGDARVAQSGEDDAASTSDAGIAGFDAGTDEGAAETDAVDALSSSANDGRPHPRLVSPGIGRTSPPPPPHKPAHGKPHPKRGP